MSTRQIFVRNLPYHATDTDLLQAFSAYGSVKRAFVVLDPVTKSSRGFGYVTFTTPDDAQKAKSALIELFGRRVYCKIADQKPTHGDSGRPKKRVREKEDETESNSKSAFTELEGTIDPAKHSDRRRCISLKLGDIGLYGALKLSVLSKLASSKLITRVQPPTQSDNRATVLLECPTRAAAVDTYMQLKEFREQDSIKFTFSYLDKKPSADKEDEETDEVKEPRYAVTKTPQSANESARDMKQFRLIARNLPFSVDENSLNEQFKRFGKIVEIVLPKNSDGTSKGFGFIQYCDRTCASKALDKMNMSDIGGRKIAVDWAVPKVVYEKHAEEMKKAEEDVVDLTEDVGGKVNTENEVAQVEVKKEAVEKEVKVKKPLPSHDIGEGRTVFIRGLSFATDEVGLMTAFEKLFGSVFYAKICLDESDRSKGTGFVKFIHKEHADECVKKSTEGPLILDGRRLLVSMALDRKGAENAKTENAKLKEANDPRNLRFAAVGYIKEGTKEAEDLSPVDLQRRHALYAGNCAKLRNPIMFVSDTRLSVHNIPTSFDDKKLKELILKVLDDKTARMTECRIMRDLDRPNAAGVGKSRGYAFVAFKEHKHAMAALEKLNNSPELFGEKKRLIVQFSIENRKVIEKKRLCLEKSREHLKKQQADKGDGAEKSAKIVATKAKNPKKMKMKRVQKVKPQVKTEVN